LALFGVTRRYSVNPQPAARIELLRLVRVLAAIPQCFAAKRRKNRKKTWLKVKSDQTSPGSAGDSDRDPAKCQRTWRPLAAPQAWRRRACPANLSAIAGYGDGGSLSQGGLVAP